MTRAYGIVMCAGLLLAPAAAATIGGASEGWTEVGGRVSCWTLGAAGIAFDCTASASGGGQVEGWVWTAQPTPTSFDVRFHGTQIASGDPAPRFPGLLARWTPAGDFALLDPVIHEGAPALIVTAQAGVSGRDGYVLPIEGSITMLPADADYRYVANEDHYRVYVNGVLAWDVTAGPKAGGATGPGISIGGDFVGYDLAWTSYHATYSTSPSAAPSTQQGPIALPGAGGESVTTPGAASPAACDLAGCSKLTPIARTCAGPACIGPTTVPAGCDPAPLLCASAITAPGQTVATPTIAPLPIVPAFAIGVQASTTVTTADDEHGATIGPVDVPLAPFTTLAVCDDPCPLPTQGAGAEGGGQIDITWGGTTLSEGARLPSA